MIRGVAKTLPVLFFLVSISGFSQDLKMERLDINKELWFSDPPVVCQFHQNEHFHGIQAKIAEIRKSGRIKEEPLSVFEVDYFGFDNQPEARAAFQYAVDIWASLIKSDIPIRVEARFRVLEPNVLGSAIPGTFFRNFENTPQFNVWYPIALAEKLAGREINSAREYDITTSFNSNFDWYYDFENPDGVDGSGLWDFVTVVLHELGHGLGFLSVVDFDADTGIGSIGLSGFPIAYTTFLESREKSLVLEIENNSTDMGDALTGGSGTLKFVSDFFGVNDPGIWAPPPSDFSGGSSVSHLDEFLYPVGNPNSLMTPSVGSNQYNHDPGIALDMMNEYGWEYVFINYDPIENSEDFSSDFELLATVTSDNPFDTATLTLHYSRDLFEGEDITIPMTKTGNENEYSATIPNSGVDAGYAYYVSVVDSKEKVITQPGTLDREPFPDFFLVLEDDSIPEINHTPIGFVLDTDDDVEFNATVSDFHMGVDTVWLEYSVNDVAQDPVGLTYDEETFNTYRYTLDLSGFNVDDRIDYKIIARDKSAAVNIANDPVDGTHRFLIETVREAISEYSNDFNSPSNDFVGNGFTIETWDGFTDGAIHSTHPYEEAGLDNEINYTYQLRSPIIIDANNPVIKFDEIALVENGEPGTVFGDDQFWDYVIVEGSDNDGQNWFRFADGWDCRDYIVWEDAYVNSINSDNISTAVGTPSMYRQRVLDMTESVFDPGDEVLIRFRMFMDEAAAGWGWAIDNLQIQGEPLAINDILNSESDFQIYPNPSSSGVYNLEAGFIKPLSTARFAIINVLGETIIETTLPAGSRNLSARLDLSGQPTGVYVAKFWFDGETVSRKLVKTD